MVESIWIRKVYIVQKDAINFDLIESSYSAKSIN